MIRLFPELYGFAIFSSNGLQEYIKQNSLSKNLLKYLEDESNSKKLMEQKLIYPIFNMDEGLYSFEYILSEDGKKSHIKSDGSLAVSGVGYLADFSYKDLIKNQKAIEFSVPQGKYEIEFIVDNQNEHIMIKFKRVKSE
ncbi:MAG: hypothetical protein OIF32_12945 [Campylobacterales bacterium]|nr:hypothetical protein [Campylobacterales bacterium]